MQTIYYTTANFIRHTDNVVDLGEYRRRLALAQEGSLAPQPGEELYDHSPAVREETVLTLREVRPRRSRQRRRLALLLDACASLSVVVMTLTFALRVLAV